MMIMRSKPSSRTRSLTGASHHRQLRLEPLEQRRLLSAAPQNVIVMIGDGMGFEHVKAGNYYAGGDLSFEQFPYQGELTTNSANAAITDSAAAATALATGQKVNNGVISMAIPGDSSELTTSLEFYQAAGKATGLVSTAYLTHATPAAFGAHETSRNNTTQIADDYFNQTLPNVLFGGGANGITASAALAAGYAVVTNAAEMDALNPGAVTYVSGQFGSTHLPYEYNYSGDLPALSDMTATALDILDNDPDGFFLMVEGGRIDHAAHANLLEETVHEVIEFSNAVQAVFDWADGRSDTLIIVTADHETGGLTVTADNGTGEYPDVDWSSGSHTATNVPVYAWGLNADIVIGVMDNTEMYSLSIGETTETLVATGSDWKYWDNGSEPADQGAVAWSDPGFVATMDPQEPETTWEEGGAQLGYGGNGEYTTVSYGNNASLKYPTTYFRREFQVTDASTYMSLDIGVLRDDGAVVYLNGQEVVRSNMPAGDISYTTNAPEPAVGGTDETTFFPYSIDPTLLVDGTNLLAVEIHQVNDTSSDLGFDLKLSGTRSAGPDTIPPTASLTGPQDNGPRDLDPSLGSVTYAFGLAAFEIQLADSGLRIDDATVTSTAVTLKQGGTTLTDEAEYTFSYDTATDVISLTGTATFDNGNYQIVLDGQIADQAGNPLAVTTFDVLIDRSLTDAFTVVMLPDTQHYTDSAANFPNFLAQTQWVADNVATENLAFVTHMGDVVQNGAAVADEWLRGDQAIDILDGVIPYSVGAGNHDFDTVDSHATFNAFDAYFGGKRYALDNTYSWYLGDEYNTTNHAQKFAAGGRQYLHLTLEWEPRQTAIDWAQSMINTNPGLPVILSTHSYLGNTGRSTGTSDGGHSGEDIFQELVSPNPQVFMVLSGHVSNEFYQVSTNDLGLDVFEILADFQGRANGGDGWMRLLEFLPDSNRIDVKTYSPSLDKFETDANSQFSLNIDFDTRFDFTFAPTASIMTPLDGGPDDLDAGAEDRVLVNQTQAQFDIRLTDPDNNIDPNSVVGVVFDQSGAVVSPSVVEVWKDGSSLLTEPNAALSIAGDFTFSWAPDGDDIIVTLTPTASSFGNGIYEINLNPSDTKIKDLDGNELAFTVLTVEIDTSITLPQTATFQQNVGGYVGTVDTHVLENAPNGSYASAISLNVDSDDPAGSGKDAQALLRFGSIFGTAAGQVPTDAAIISATLELNVTNVGDSINLHRMARIWSDSDSWNDLGAGIQADDAEALVSPDVSTGAVTLGTLSLDVAASLTAWRLDPSTNFGWALLPTNTNGIDFDSAEGGTPPKLIVEFLPADQNSPPVALADSAYVVAEDGVLNVVVASGVLANDTDADGDPLSASLLSNVNDGTLVLNGDGSFDYTPDPDFNGPDSFEYIVDDGNGGTDTATVTIAVTPVNDAPVATSQVVQTAEDTSLGITLGAIDADGNSLTYTVVTAPAQGTLSGTAPNLTYIPAANYNGPDSFTFTANDGTVDSNVATISLTVTAVNDAPTLTPIGDQNVNEENPLTFTVSGSDGNETQTNDLIYSATGLPTGAALDENTGEFTWTPTETQQGVYAHVTFTVTDDDASPLSDSETITITVNGVNDPPVLADIPDVSFAEDASDGSIDLDSYYTDIETAAADATFEVVSSFSGVTAGIDPDTHLLTITGDSNFNGQGDITVRVTDTGDGSSVALLAENTLHVTVNAVNDPPTVIALIADETVQEDAPDSVLDLSGVFDDVDILTNGDSLTLSLVGNSNPGLVATGLVGTNLTLSYATGQNGTANITIRATDSQGAWVEDTFLVTVLWENDPPTVLNPIADETVAEDAADTALDLSGVFDDADILTYGDSLTLSVQNTNAALVTTGLSGTDLTLSYAADQSGTAKITVRATDLAGAWIEDAFTVTVTPVNDAPVANPDSITVDEGGTATVLDSLAGSVLDNDTDADSPSNLLTAVLDSGATYGTVTLNPDGTFSYGHDGSEYFADSFTYHVNDGTDDGNSVTVSITVNPVNDAPVSNSQTVETDEDTPVDVTLTGSDAEGQALTFIVVSGPTNGVLSGTAPDLTYTPDVDYHGPDSFTFKANDTLADSIAATVSITVNSVNDAPVAVDDSVATDQDTAVTIFAADLLANDSDVDGDTLSLTGWTAPGNGTLVDNGGVSFTYTPNPGFSGTDTFDYTVSDGNAGTDTGTVTITVAPGELPFYAIRDLPGSGTVFGSFADTEGSNDVRQTITEVVYAGNRSRLEHIWDFDQVNGATKFVVEAYRSDLSVDDFQFEYSTDGVNWTTMIPGITATTPEDEQPQEHLFAVPLSGTIQVRVTDTDRNKERTLDTISIDEMYFLCQTGPVLPTVTITATDATAAEQDSDPGEFTVTRTGDLVGDLTVAYTVGGTTDTADYSETLTLSVTILDGSSSASIPITPVDDLDAEGPETVVLTIASDPAYAIGSASSGTVTIADNEAPVGQTFDSTDTPKNILDGKRNPRRTRSQLLIASTGTVVGSLDMDLSIAHDAPTDLRGYLVSPAGTKVTLFEGNGSFPATYTGLDFVGEAMDGTWTLELWDDVKGTAGTLDSWSLTITAGAAAQSQSQSAPLDPDAVDEVLAAAAATMSAAEASEEDPVDELLPPPIDPALLDPEV